MAACSSGSSSSSDADDGAAATASSSSASSSSSAADDDSDDDDSDAAASLAAQDAATQFASGEDVAIAVADVTEDASYFDYDADGTTVQLFAVLASDGTVRVALNTCQVCAGSTKAYYVQEGDEFVCQNCGNAFDTDDIGYEGYGCNPVPVTTDDYETDGETITIAASYLAQYASAFSNWKA